MGKVGSWTIVRAVQAAEPTMTLSELQQQPVSASWIAHTHSIVKVDSWLRDRPGGTGVLLVSAVRDLLRNSISAFFQNITNTDANALAWHLCMGTQDEVLRLPVEVVIRHFEEWVAMPSLVRAEGFMQGFGNLIGTDAFSLAFDRHGLAHGDFSGGRYAVMRLNRMADALPALGRVLGVELPLRENLNTASDKWYAEPYARFLERFEPSAELLDAFYDSRFSRGLFTDDERRSFRERWRSGPGARRDAEP